VIGFTVAADGFLPEFLPESKPQPAGG